MFMVNHLVGFGANDVYAAQAVNFDGANDYLTRDAGLTGASDSKMLTASVWLKTNAANGTNQRFFTSTTNIGGGSANQSFRCFRTTGSNIFGFIGENSSGTLIFQVNASTAFVAADGWVHYLLSLDMSDSGKRHFLRNGSDDANWVTYTNDTIDFTVADWCFGGFPDGSSLADADTAEFLFWPGAYIDLSVADNIRLFRDSNGKPRDPIWAKGALGTPAVELSRFRGNGATDYWHQNRGSGGGFTENGSLTDSSTSPSD